MVIRKAASVVVGAAMLLGTTASVEAASVAWRTIVGIGVPGLIVGSFDGKCPINGQGCVKGAGLPWSAIQGLSEPLVTLDLATGNLAFKVDGLVLAGGNAIGSADQDNRIIGSLICIVPPPGANVIVNTGVVSLSNSGDANFTGSVGALPPSCNPFNIHFLIRLKDATGPWIANGAARVP